VQIGELYEKDSNFFSQMAIDLMLSSKAMSTSISEVNNAMHNVTKTASLSVTSTEEILNYITHATYAVNDVAKATQHQAKLTEVIHSLVNKFKIS